MRRRLLLLAVLVLGALPVQAQVRRCTAANGTTIFTDRRCQDLGAVERIPRDAVARITPLYRNACARTLQDLVYELTTSIDSRDVNRLAGVYQWTGLSTTGGYAIMNRLQRIVDRPLLDVSPIYAGSADPQSGVDADYYPQRTARHAPIAIRLEQTLANGSTPSHTVLGLRRHLGCWWVSL
jgi:hypothetical protein